MKSTTTLVKDMEEVLLGHGGWDKALSDVMANTISSQAVERFSKPQEPRGYLSMSSLGTPCYRKLWYKINQTKSGEPLQASALLKFFFGDMIEELALCIAQQAGHSVEGQQDYMSAHGIKGRRDCVINGMTVDVKSASPYSFKKFKEGAILTDDPFGYIAQLSAYAHANKVKEAGFVVIDKSSGEIAYCPVHHMEMINAEERINHLKKMVKSPILPDRCYDDIPDGKSGNRRLAVGCNFCEHKRHCWSDANNGAGLREFKYSNGSKFLTHVERTPDVEELYA